MTLRRILRVTSEITSERQLEGPEHWLRILAGFVFAKRRGSDRCLAIFLLRKFPLTANAQSMPFIETCAFQLVPP